MSVHEDAGAFAGEVVHSQARRDDAVQWWGATSSKVGPLWINARAQTVHEKSGFCAAFRRQYVVADGEVGTWQPRASRRFLIVHWTRRGIGTSPSLRSRNRACIGKWPTTDPHCVTSPRGRNGTRAIESRSIVIRPYGRIRTPVSSSITARKRARFPAPLSVQTSRSRPRGRRTKW